MGIILPEKVLQTQICSVCNKYLSYQPVKIYKEGTKCGRCSSESEIGINSKYNNIAESIIFPCVNRYEGCQQLLRYQEVPEHEKTCFGDKFSCPICPEDKYPSDSLLRLVNHYRIFHSDDYITKPFFFVDTESFKEHVYMYCDNSENILLFIHVQLNNNKMCVNVFTVGQRVDKIKYKISLLINGLQKYESLVQKCPGAGSNFNVLEIDCFRIIKEAPIFLCVMDFDTSEALNYTIYPDVNEYEVAKRKVPNSEKYENECGLKGVGTKKKTYSNNETAKNYGKFLNGIYKNPYYLKTLPDVYLTKEFLDTNGRVFKKQIGDFFHLQKCNGETFNTICKFCENYLSTSGSYLPIYFCSHVTAICGTCFQMGLKKCQVNCKVSYDRQARHYKLLYYCRFGCKKFFKGGELSIHERWCELNPEALLSNSELAKLYFGDYFVENSKESKSVVVRGNKVVFNDSLFGERGQIYVITDYNFQCIIFYKVDDGFYRFQAAHEYCPDTYYIMFKVVSNNTICKEVEINSFSVSLEDTRSLFFVVLLRKFE